MKVLVLRLSAPGTLLLAALLCTACGGEDHPPAPPASRTPFAPSPPPNVPAQPARDDVATGACDKGTARDCRVWLPSSGGIKNCFQGTQACAEDMWSDCLSDEDAAELLGG